MGEQWLVPRTDTWRQDDLHVALASPSRTSGPVPTVVLLDGQSMFLTAVEFSRTVSLLTGGALPPMAIAAVWRASTDFAEYTSTRFRDFTPYEWDLPGPFTEDNEMIRHGTGGAGNLLAELVDGLLPSLRERFDVGAVTIGGWSLSGLFAAWAWRERPDVFDHLLAVSPSLWWHDARLVDEGVPLRSGARAFISAGEHEEGDMTKVWPPQYADPAQREAAGMVRNAVAFGTRCADAGVDTLTWVVPDEHHVTLVPASLARGLRHLVAGA
jgi:hypothetical protein